MLEAVCFIRSAIEPYRLWKIKALVFVVICILKVLSCVKQVKNNRVLINSQLTSLCQTKTRFRETRWLTGRRATPLVTLFFGVTKLLTGAMPCQWSSSDLPRVLQIWETVFYAQAFFTLHSFLLVLRLPWESAVQLQS